ncbi:cysteine proteinase 2-like [Dioscorea cayenensis subsp. rotundata]|uniref:Cysteine proteinase 2-like n=1 Tax=Dioscorea cayennensis subsp. rotundata TaxID=55577 RepID=A0AB40BK91_DIOCR|nr:cysteine proteinase 2-like [Dioscorea cayenensis subsp. rotundata]
MMTRMFHLLLLIIIVRSIACSSSSTRPSTIKSLILATLGRSNDSLTFADFAQSYEKQYKSAEEIHKRFGIFMDNFHRIRSTNKKGLRFTVGINEFTDMSFDEFKSKRLIEWNTSVPLANRTRIYNLTDAVAPLMKDWRNDGIISPVRQQGDCFACWAFSAAGAIEAAKNKLENQTVTVSVRQLVDCSTADGGCEGGRTDSAFLYVARNGGINSDPSYPYTGTEGTCSFDPNHIAAKVTGVEWVHYGDEEDLEKVVGLIGPVSVGIQAEGDFLDYKGGIYRTTSCGDPGKLNHAMLVVGYGLDYFDDQPYWILKNSWGDGWGVGGYLFMEKGTNMCGVAYVANFPTVE